MSAKIILLNGPSSAGKSTLAQALQAHLPEPFLRFSLDVFFDGAVLPPRQGRGGDFDWAVMRPKLFEGFFDCLSALANAGNNLVVDHIIETQPQLDRLVRTLEPFDVFFVGVHCPLPELERRERERGDRRTGDAQRDLETVHSFSAYDFEVDSTLVPAINAERIALAWEAREPSNVFQRLASA